MKVPERCKECVPEQVLHAETLGAKHCLRLCPLLGLLALRPEECTPHVKRHFLSMADGCVNGNKPIVQQVTGQPLVDAVSTIRERAEAEGVIPARETVGAA